MTRKILLADDSLTIQKVVELTFSDSEYELVCVSNGQKALDRIRDDRPDLVLADVVMPEKNGYEVCEAIKSNPATARIPVLLLSGTFEPFDRERAERIGADAIVSKPFDSQQLIAQVEALLDRAPAASFEGPSESQTTVKLPVVDVEEPPSSEPDEAPFDVGFSAEDFTASVRIPSRGIDPFEEEYGRGDVDSAIEEFEKSQPLTPPAAEAKPVAPQEPPVTGEQEREDAGREPLAQWLREEPEKPAAASVPPSEEETIGGMQIDTEATVAISLPLPPPVPPPADSVPEMGSEAPQEAAEQGKGAELEEEGEKEEEVFFDASREAPSIGFEPAAEAGGDGSGRAGGEAAATAEVPREIEMLAQTSSIPELTEMLSSVAKASGGDFSDEQIERLARRVVEKLSDRIVREIAWEVIPDMAEIVIKQRIKELEASAE